MKPKDEIFKKAIVLNETPLAFQKHYKIAPTNIIYYNHITF